MMKIAPGAVSLPNGKSRRRCFWRSNFISEYSLEIKGYAENLPDGRVRIVCEGEEEKILKLENSLKETPPPFARVDHTEIKFVPYAGEFTSFERKGHDVIEEDENTTTLLKSMVNYMKIFVDKSEVVNTRLGEIKVSVDDMHVTLKSVKEDTAAIRYDTKEIATKLWEKYEELSKEIVQIKITLSKIGSGEKSVGNLKKFW
ncbi:acylphosphatase [groundwater metagenome]